jgi:hypothetical protein
MLITLTDGKMNDFLVDVKDCKATEYISWPASQSHSDETLFKEENIKVIWMEYPEYSQLYPPFDHAIAVLDSILNERQKR